MRNSLVVKFTRSNFSWRQLMKPKSHIRSARSVAITLNGGKVCEDFRNALFEAAGREGKSVNELVLEATGAHLRSLGYQFPGVFPTQHRGAA